MFSAADERPEKEKKFSRGCLNGGPFCLKVNYEH